MKTIPHCTLPCILFLTSILLASCKQDELEMPLGKWVLTEYNNRDGNAMILEFGTDNSMYIDFADDNIPPFHESCEWDYRLDRDSVLNISYYYATYDGEGSTTTYSQTYKLPLSFSNGGRTLTLQYEETRLFQSNIMHTYTFIRR